MDAVRVSVINTSAVEGVPISIAQDTTREVLLISAPGLSDLLDYSPQTIGA